jgi:hypothetical protein
MLDIFVFNDRGNDSIRSEEKRLVKRDREKIFRIPEEKLHKALGWPENFPFDEKPVSGLWGKVYQWIKNRYFKNRHPWTKSDVIIWKGACTVMPVQIGYVLFAALFYWLFGGIYNHFGIGRLIAMVAIIFLWRFGVLLNKLNSMSDKLDELNKRFGGS